MPRFCSGSAKVSLPNVLQSLFYQELAPQLRAPSTRTRLLNGRFLPRHNITSKRTISAVPINSIPIPSAEEPQAPPSTEKEPAASKSSRAVSKKASDGKSSAKSKRAKRSESTSRAEPKSEVKNAKQKRERGRSSKLTSRAKPKPEPKNAKKKWTRKDRKAAAEGRKDTAPKQFEEPEKPEEPKPWLVQRKALQKKFPEGWAPIKKLSPDAMDGIRHLHHVSPEQFTTPVLAEEFKVSPEAIRRILKSKWRPTAKQQEERQDRWGKRHEYIWGHMSELGLREKPPNAFKATAPVLYGPQKSKKPRGGEE